MKLIVFSDSHGERRYISRALLSHPDADAVFFLGDGLSDMEECSLGESRPWLFVRGNCDIYGSVRGTPAPLCDEIVLEGKRIVYTHGHAFDVKFSLDGVMSLAEERRADLVLFGHTHRPLEKYANLSHGGVYIFNPGSVSGRDGSPAYGVITLTERGVLLSHAYPAP